MRNQSLYTVQKYGFRAFITVSNGIFIKLCEALLKYLNFEEKT